MTKKVAVALSGGVDSAVTALLLKNQGYDVIGVTAKMTCDGYSQEIIDNATNVAKKIGIEHYIVDSTTCFKNNVIDYFQNSYKNAMTPNPCIMCNTTIKWGLLFNYVINELKCDYIATGHYAKIIKSEYGIYKLYPASDEHKDQLYFLFTLNQLHLSKTLFPLSNYKKADVRKIAIDNDLPPKSSKESQDICFIKKPNTTKKYLNDIFAAKEGAFVEKLSGKLLGKHQGFWQYTIGQRKGIGIAAPYPLYVVGIDAIENIVYVGAQDELYSKELILSNQAWSYDFEKKDKQVYVKIRYNMPFVKANVKFENGNIKIIFDEPVSAITSGQACVLYDINDMHLLGGGFINQ